MVDAIELLLRRDLGDLAFEHARSVEVGAERLLHDDARERPLAPRIEQARSLEVLEDRREVRRRSREIEDSISGKAALALDGRELLAQANVGLGIVEGAFVIVHAGGEVAEQLLVDGT